MNIVMTILISALLIWFIYENFVPVKGIHQIKTDELKKIVKDKNYQFLDVRTPMEFKGNHIKKFENIPVYELKKRHNELEKDKEVVLICQSGMRSNKASKVLKKLGFSKITNVKGGMATWSH